MRLLALLMMLTACNCATSSDLKPQITVTALQVSTPPEEPATGFVPGPTGHPHWVPHICLTGDINEGMQRALTATMRATDELFDAKDDAGYPEAMVIELNSSGGNVDEGFLMAKAIEDVDFPVVCVVDGDAMSTAFYILQSCDYRVMTKRSNLMAHEPAFVTTNFVGRGLDWTNKAEALRTAARGMAEQESRRMKVTVEEFQRRTAFGQEWHFTWEDALKYGAVDLVVDRVRPVVGSMRMTLRPPQPVVELPPGLLELLERLENAPDAGRTTPRPSGAAAHPHDAGY